MELAKEGKITTAVTLTNGAAGATNINGVTLDMQGFERVLMAVSVGAVVSGAATSIKRIAGRTVGRLRYVRPGGHSADHCGHRR